MTLLTEIRACTACKDTLPLGPNPIVSFSSASQIIIVGQAPGKKVHLSSVPWDDASGARLREWLGVSSSQFYNTDLFGIVPMGFCYPGKGKSGDLPPRPECAALWMKKIFNTLEKKQTVVLIGQYAQRHFLGSAAKSTLTETVKHWRDYYPEYIVLPHSSPRNNIWLYKNTWFMEDVIPNLQKIITRILIVLVVILMQPQTASF